MSTSSWASSSEHAETLLAVLSVLLALRADGEEPASPAPAVPGYEVEAELRRGGMGVVYRAWQVALRRPVALKVLLRGTQAGPDAVRRFLAEAELAARLRHPHIVQVFELGESRGLPFLAMELIRGRPLSAALSGQPQPARSAARPHAPGLAVPARSLIWRNLGLKR